MKWRIAVLCSLASILISWPMAAEAAPKTKPKKGAVDATAKKMDVFKAMDDRQIEVQVTIQGPGSALLTLTNVSEIPLNVEVPLALGAVPNTPPSANLFGGQQGPPFIAAVSPNWATGVDKKGTRKSNVKTNKKTKDGDEGKDEKKGDEEAKKEEEKKADAVVTTVPLPPGGIQQLTMSTLGLDKAKLRGGLGLYKIADVEKVSQAPELKKLLEQYGQGKIPADTAQILAWHYQSRDSWEDMERAGFFPAQLEIAKKFADIVEGRAAPETAPETDTKKKKK